MSPALPHGDAMCLQVSTVDSLVRVLQVLQGPCALALLLARSCPPQCLISCHSSSRTQGPEQHHPLASHCFVQGCGHLTLLPCDQLTCAGNLPPPSSTPPQQVQVSRGRAQPPGSLEARHAPAGRVPQLPALAASAAAVGGAAGGGRRWLCSVSCGCALACGLLVHFNAPVYSH